MNTILWIAQALAAAMFAMAGVMKSTQPREKLVKMLPWVKDFSMGTVRFIGISELLGAIGLIVPWSTGILPFLSPLAAAALCVDMTMAAAYHARKKEYNAIAINSFLFLISAFVVYGRFIALN